MARRNTEADFWAQTQRSATGCLEWTGSTDDEGYGRMILRFEEPPLVMHAAHRIAWRLTYGPIPPGLHVLHHCDNPPCCNTEGCLFLGTHQDNMDDMVAKGRHVAPGVPGERHWHSRLTEVSVRAIRSMYGEGISGVQLARMFNVADRTVYDVLQRRTWDHVAGDSEHPYLPSSHLTDPVRGVSITRSGTYAVGREINKVRFRKTFRDRDEAIAFLAEIEERET